MQTLIRYRGRELDERDVGFVRQFIAERPGASRRALSIELCKAWQWTQPNGAVCDAVCRGLLLALHRAGHIELPPARWRSDKSPWRRHKPEQVELDQSPLEVSLAELGRVEVSQVRRSGEESLVNSLVEHHHYLGYSQPVGEHLKYLFSTGTRPLGCMMWSSAPRHLAPRDRYIGWAPPVRRANIRFVAYQTRFLILPWVRVPHLASHLLGKVTRQLSVDWQALYAHPIYFTETFVDPERNRGTCYRAANWTCLGLTKGRGKADQTKKQNRSLKLLFGQPLVGDFRKRLCIESERAP